MSVRTRVLLSVAVVGLAIGVWRFTSGGSADPAAGAGARGTAESAPPALSERKATPLAGAAGRTPSPPTPPTPPEEIAAQPGVPATDPGAPLEPAHLTGIVRDAKTKAPLFGARILVGMKERTLHDLRVVAEPPLEARTDAEGRFSLDVPVPVEGFTIRVDAMSKGYRSLSGPYSSGAGGALQVAVQPGGARSVELELTRGFAVAGLVRDVAGSPIEDVQIQACEEDRSGTRYMAFTRTDRDGRFEVYDFDVGDDPEREGSLAEARLHLDHADFVPLVSGDLRTMTEAERTTLDLRMVRGFSIEGLVRTPEGGAAAGLLLEAVHDEQGWRRSVTTERDGSFRLRGVPRGTVTLSVADFVRRLVGKARVTLEAEAQRASVDLVPIQGNQPGASVRLLGLDLVELTEAERAAFGFGPEYHVMIVGTGENPEALGVGRLQPGDCIWYLGGQAIPDVRTLAEILVAKASWTTRPLSMSLVYGMRREGGFAGTNTQGLTLSAAQVDEVRAWLAARPK